MGYLYPSPLLRLRQCYPTPELLLMTTATPQLNKLPLSTIIFRTTDNKNGFNNHNKCLKKIQHLVQYVSIVTASNENLTFYFRFQTTDTCYF